MKFWDLKPALERLRDREPNHVFATVQPGRALVIYFTSGGSVEADLADFPAHCDVRWLDLAQAEWKGTATARGGNWARLTAPGGGAWIALIEAK